MGNYIGVFEETEEQIKSKLSTTQSDWITGHADLTGLAVVEVERSWNRFLQLGGTKLGFLEKISLEKGPELIQDVIIKNIVSNLPKDKKGRLSFHVFLNFMKWLEEADTENKLKVIHSFLNNGQELNDRTFTRILKRMYPDHSEEEVTSTCDLLMSQLDPDRTGKILEMQFVTNTLKNYDEYELSEILIIDLIPNEALEQLNIEPKLSSDKNTSNNNQNRNITSNTNRPDYGPISHRGRRGAEPNGEEYLDNQLLESIAKKAVNKDWEKLSIKLGFLEYDIQSYKLKNKGYNLDAMIDILFTWRDQDPFMATKSRLKRYLEDSNMMDAACLLK